MKTLTASSSCGSLPPPLTQGTDRLPAPPPEPQRFLQALGEAFRHAELHDVLHWSFPDRLHRAEVSQQDALARGPDAFDGIERRRQRLTRADLAVMCDREAMGLVADALDQEHARRVALLHDGFRATRREDLLALLGQRKRRDVGIARRL